MNTASEQDRQRARDYLRVQQRSVYEQFPTLREISRIQPGFWTDLMSDEIERLPVADRPTEYERMPWYVMLRELYRQTELSARELGLSPQTRPVIGTLPSGVVNAYAMVCPGAKSRIIVFEEGLFAFAHLAAKIIVMALAEEAGTQCWKFRLVDFLNAAVKHVGDEAASTVERTYELLGSSLSTRSEPVVRLLDILTSYIVGGHPHRAHLIPVDESRLEFALRHFMEMFVMGHELGHIVRGHLDESQSFRRMMLSDRISHERVQLSWQQEYEADAVGLMLLMTTNARETKLSVPECWLGTAFFFSCIDLIERTLAVLQTGELNTATTNSTHPPIELRRAALRGLVGLMDAETVEKALQLERQLDATVASLWSHAGQDLRELHRRGLRPAARWLRDGWW